MGCNMEYGSFLNRNNIRYSCPERDPEVQGCQYRGKIYAVGEAITDQLLPKRCYEECICEHWKDQS